MQLTSKINVAVNGSYYSFCFTNFRRVPTVGGKALDLHQLFLEVTSRGGIEKVYYLVSFSKIF